MGLRDHRGRHDQKASEKVQKVIHAQLSIAEDFAQQAAANILGAMLRHGNDSTVRVAQPDVAAALAYALETGSRQSGKDFAGPDWPESRH